MEVNKLISPKGLYELDIPDSWESENTDMWQSFYNPDTGCGALQISAYSAPNETEANPSNLLLEHLRNQTIKYSEADIELKDSKNIRLAAIHFIRDEIYWKLWFIAKSRTVLFMTYNCGIADIGREEKEVEAMISSINILK